MEQDIFLGTGLISERENVCMITLRYPTEKKWIYPLHDVKLDLQQYGALIAKQDHYEWALGLGTPFFTTYEEGYDESTLVSYIGLRGEGFNKNTLCDAMHYCLGGTLINLYFREQEKK